MKGYCDYPGHVGDFHAREKICRNWRQALPVHVDHLATETQIEVAPKAETPEQTIERLNKRIYQLEHELAGAADRYIQLNGIYQKLADQWNAYQATAKPDNRNVHRAEAAGELGRKLAEVLIGVAYDKDVRKALYVILDALAHSQGVSTVIGKRLVPDVMKIYCPGCGKITPECRCVTGR